MSATTAGYPGVTNADGPVDPPKGEESPRPASRDCAKKPKSGTLLNSQFFGKLESTSPAIPKRNTNARARIVLTYMRPWVAAGCAVGDSRFRVCKTPITVSSANEEKC